MASRLRRSCCLGDGKSRDWPDARTVRRAKSAAPLRKRPQSKVKPKSYVAKNQRRPLQVSSSSSTLDAKAAPAAGSSKMFKSLSSLATNKTQSVTPVINVTVPAEDKAADRSGRSVGGRNPATKRRVSPARFPPENNNNNNNYTFPILHASVCAYSGSERSNVQVRCRIVHSGMPGAN